MSRSVEPATPKAAKPEGSPKPTAVCPRSGRKRVSAVFLNVKITGLITERRYIHLFDAQLTDEMVREAMSR
jgi:hypothetical protein